MLKKLKDNEANLIRDIIRDDDPVIELDNKRYYVSLIKETKIVNNGNAESDPVVKRKMEQTKKGILNGKDFAIDDVVEMIDLGVL